MAKIIFSQLTEFLAPLNKWQDFADHLPGIKPEHVERIDMEERNIPNKKRALYNKWLAIYPDATWQDVIIALEKAEEYALAKKVKEKYCSQGVSNVVGATGTQSTLPGATDVSPDRVREILKRVLQEQSGDLTDLLYGCLPNVATQMFAKRLITQAVYRNPTYISVMNDYENGMKFKTVPELEKHCQLFLDCLSSQGGPLQAAAKVIAGCWKDEINKELGIILNLNVY